MSLDDVVQSPAAHCTEFMVSQVEALIISLLDIKAFHAPCSYSYSYFKCACVPHRGVFLRGLIFTVRIQFTNKYDGEQLILVGVASTIFILSTNTFAREFLFVTL